MDRYKSFFLNPVVLFPLVWGGVFFADYIYGLFRPDFFFDFSSQFYFLFSLVVLFWFLGFASSKLIPVSVYRLNNFFDCLCSSSYTRLGFLYVSVMSLSTFFMLLDRYLHVGQNFYLPDGVMQYRIILTIDGGRSYFPWLSLFNFFYFFFPCFFVFWYFSDQKIVKILAIFGFLNFLAFVYFSTARSAIFFPLLTTFFVYIHYRFKVRYFLFVFFMLFLLFGLMGSVVGKSGFEKFFIYLISPAHAFDIIYQGIVEFSPGFLSFRIFHPILHWAGLIDGSLLYIDNILTPYPTNVFTFLGVFYLDFGVYGMLFMVYLFSFASSVLFLASKYRRSPRAVFMSSLSCVLICLGVFYDYYTSTFFVVFSVFYVVFFLPKKRNLY